ncbi:MAG: NAD(P)H-dependent oxidoreductase subunit E [Planctomycetota bacterium]|nr:NAD(P)H-dependent oxidoreductase subunit E [Planctomycetota bacterium]MDA1212153.1 NAD(P)H-dependent oxidoreductase subunit E [Planctomycetota bacterium]
MKLLRAMSERQHALGYLSDQTLRELAKEFRVPLYRLEGLVSFYPYFRRTPPPRNVVQVCRDVVCCLAGREAAMAELRSRSINDPNFAIEEVSCVGRCDAAPAVAINENPLAPYSLNDIDTWWNTDLSNSRGGESPKSFRCDPYPEEQCRYGTVRELLSRKADLPATCIERLAACKLRGMGGAGFPTGKKWEMVADEQASPKFVICNADESEPGTFKDREILSQLPHLVIEGMLLAGLTVGAEQGIIYLRHEYLPEKQSIDDAIQFARDQKILGPNAAGSGRSFDIEIFVSPGGYILGEETALLQALEDERGEPRIKPPYPGTHGLWNMPTLINNVETFALAVPIIHHGPEWWEMQGMRGSAGLKFVSISGDVEHPGPYEIPLGTTVRELIDLAGGMKDGIELLAFLPGGASSNFLPADKADTPLDFDAMKTAGSMLGTGAVIVMNDTRDLWSLAVNLVEFFRNESCGKCVPCRLGSEQAVGILHGISQKTRPASDLAIVQELAPTLEQTSICGLGQVALNPIMSLLKHFPDVVPG